MRIDIKRDPGRWYSLPWTVWVFRDDGPISLGFGVGATRNSAIRAAFDDVAKRIINPPKRPTPVHTEEIKT